MYHQYFLRSKRPQLLWVIFRPSCYWALRVKQTAPQETADGELVVLHDLPSLLAASLGAPANAAAAAALRAAGVDPATAGVHVRLHPCLWYGSSAACKPFG